METWTCTICEAPADVICPRCQRPCCAHHRRQRGAGWPAEAYDKDELCVACAESLSRGSRAVGRVVVGASAGVLGAALSALLVLLIGNPLGLGADLTVLGMLIAELVGGGGAAYLADRRLQRWFVERDQSELHGLPEARLLPPGSHD